VIAATNKSFIQQTNQSVCYSLGEVPKSDAKFVSFDPPYHHRLNDKRLGMRGMRDS
jgi:hypothetical protein